MTVPDLAMRGHAIEVRIYAEDAANGFLPSIGPLAVFRPPTGPGLRLDTGVREGDEVSPSYDPMLAKLIVHAPSRAEALQRMRRALDDFVILGTTTNVAFLRDLCDLEAVTSAKTSTTTLDEAYPSGWAPRPASEAVLALGAVLASARSSRPSGGEAGPAGPSSPFLSLSRRYP